MLNVAATTIYTGPTDDWESLTSQAGLSRNELVALNPHLESVERLEAGIPVDVPAKRRESFIAVQLAALAARPSSAYEVAKRELMLDIAEDPRPGKDNPRIRLYHSTTSGGAQPDEVAWCSSFVNYCTEQAGQVGTDSKAARSWLRWGVAVPETDWREGDVVVFWRESPSSWKGHVGFLVAWDGPRPLVLGGNQDNRLRISSPYRFSRILGVRRLA